MGPIFCLALVVLVAASNTNAAGNCIGKCYPGIRQQGKLGVTVGNLAANLGAPSGLEVFSYFASDSELKRFYAKGKRFDAKGTSDGSVIELLHVLTEVTTFPLFS